MLRTACFLLFATAILPAQADELTFLVDTGTEMPMAQFQGRQLVGGLHYDIGQALAKAMGHNAKFETLPRQRMENALEKSSVDLSCGYTPQWLSGQFAWSQPFLATVQVLLTSASVERPRKISDVSGQAIGTVLGYKYAELDQLLGNGFVRDDGPSTDASLRKLAVGRMSHAVISQYIYHYRLKQRDMPLAVHEPLLIKRDMTQCAVASKGRATLSEVNAGIGRLLRNGTVAEIVAKYR